MNLRDYITVDPESFGGEACIAGTSVPVSAILEKLAAGLDADEILRSFPLRLSGRHQGCRSFCFCFGKECGIGA